MKKDFINFSILAVMALSITGCSHDFDLYEGPQPDGSEQEPKVANAFDFKTTQDVNLTVDYASAGAVFFEVYAENPIVKTLENDIPVISRNKNAKSLYGGYTNANGHFSGKVTLPAYATHLYIYSGNMLLDTNLLETDVNGGQAIAKAESTAQSRALTRAMTDQTLTDEVPVNFYSWAHDGTGASYNDSYKAEYTPITKGNGGWKTPLGKWNSLTGRPDYLLDKNDAANKDLVFNSDELRGLFEVIQNAVAVDKNCPEEFRAPGDLTLQRNSEVAINMLGGTTMWSNSLGYYYYNGTAPTDLATTPIIMLFPNTNDGHGTAKDWGFNVIGVERGDAVKLVYYPHIAEGNFDDATTEFPAGTSIGFVLKCNGWGAALGKEWVKDPWRYHGAVLNWWCTSTEGLSYCPDGVESGVSKLGQSASRTAKFAFTSGGDEFAVISFEDMNHDTNFADVAFALKPASAFQPLPQIVNKTTDESGVYAFEDLWPSKGDYDMNDVLVDYKYGREFAKYDNQSDDEYKTIRESFSFTTYQNYAALHSGLAFTFSLADNPTNIVFKKRPRDSSDFVDADFTVEDDDNVVILTNDINNEIGTEYLVEVTYEKGTTRRTSIKPFIFRNTENGKRLEVHLPFEAPTAWVDESFFGTEDDLSNPAQDIYYVRAGDYPYAFYLAGGDIEAFKNTLLNSAFERKPVDTVYPKFLEWSTSKGARATDWYK